MALYVYILKCADGKYYTGLTNDPERRLHEHRTGEYPNAYTRIRLPVEMVFCMHFPDGTHLQAIDFERTVKGWRRAKKEALIEDRWTDLPELAKCLNGTHHSNKPKRVDGPRDPGTSASDAR